MNWKCSPLTLREEHGQSQKMPFSGVAAHFC